VTSPYFIIVFLYANIFAGGDDGTRTHDPCLAKAVL